MDLLLLIHNNSVSQEPLQLHQMHVVSFKKQRERKYMICGVSQVYASELVHFNVR